MKYDEINIDYYTSVRKIKQTCSRESVVACYNVGCQSWFQHQDFKSGQKNHGLCMSVSPNRMIGLCTVGVAGCMAYRLGKLGKSGRKTQEKPTKFSAVPVEIQLSQGSWILKVQDSHEVDDLWQPELPYCAISRNRDMMSSTDNGGLGCNKSRGRDCWCHQTSEASKRPQNLFQHAKGKYGSFVFHPTSQNQNPWKYWSFGSEIC